MPKRILEGTIISDKMEKTVVVKVERMKQHPKYKKRYKVFKKYKAHVEGDDFTIGDKVTIMECRAISKDKTWRVIGTIAKTSEKEITEKEEKKEIKKEVKKKTDKEVK